MTAAGEPAAAAAAARRNLNSSMTSSTHGHTHPHTLFLRYTTDADKNNKKRRFNYI